MKRLKEIGGDWRCCFCPGSNLLHRVLVRSSGSLLQTSSEINETSIAPTHRCWLIFSIIAALRLCDFHEFHRFPIIPYHSFIFFHGYCWCCDAILPLDSFWSLGDGHTAQPGSKIVSQLDSRMAHEKTG